MLWSHDSTVVWCRFRYDPWMHRKWSGTTMLYTQWQLQNTINLSVYITCNHSHLYYMCTRHTSQCCESSVQVHSTAQDWLDISIDNASTSLLTYIRIEMPIPTKKQYSCTHMCISQLRHYSLANNNLLLVALLDLWNIYDCSYKTECMHKIPTIQ